MDGLHRGIDLAIGSIEVRRDSNADAGPKVHQDVAAGQLTHYGGRIGDIDGDHAAPSCCVPRRLDLPPILIRKLDQPASLPNRFFPDLLDTGLKNDFIAAFRRI